MLGEPDEVEPEPVQPLQLVEDRAVKRRVGHARIRRVGEIANDADTEIGFRHQIVSWTPKMRQVAKVDPCR